MLCKTTMRAALAPVIGLVGVLIATSAAAEVVIGGGGKPGRYAAESLHNKGCVGTPCSHFVLAASAGELLLTAQTDILLPTEQYYLRYDLANAVFSEQIGSADIQQDVTIPTNADGDPVPGDNTEAKENREFVEWPTGVAVAWKGNRGDASIILQLPSQTFPLGSWIALDLSGAADDGTTATVNELHSQIAIRAGNATARIAVYDSLSNARLETAALFQAGPSTIASTRSATSVSITTMYDVADVSTSTDDGGPFRRFVPGGMGGKDSGVLGMVEITFNPGDGLKDTQTNKAATAALIGSTRVDVESAAGNFAVSTKNGELNTDAGGGNPWMVADNPECTNGALTLGLIGGDLDKYPAGHAKANRVTPAGIRAANKAGGNAKAKVGVNYFCVLVKGNLDPIPEIGDPDSPSAYKLTAHPKLADVENQPASARPAATTMNIGAIDRNGTTVHVPYLTTNPFVDQRLVLVNRGNDEVMFWVEDDSFNLEDGTTVPKNNLSLDMGEMIPAKGRRVIGVSNVIEFAGQTRGSATVNVAAPTRDIDVMTIQRSPFTDEVDTTLYAPE